MSENRRRKAAAAFAAAVGLCLAFIPPSLAFQLQALHGVRVNSEVSSSSSRSHPFRGRRSAATCRKLTINAGGQGHKGEEERRHAAGIPISPAASRDSDCGTSEESSVRSGGGKDVAAFVLSTLLLCNPRLAEAASPNTRASLAPSTVSQERLLADLEKKLMISPSGPERGAKVSSSAPEKKEADSGAKTGPRATRDAAVQPTAEEQPPTPPTASDSVPLSASQDVPASAASAAPPAVTAKPSAAAKSELSPDLEVNSLGTKEKGPLVKFQEYTFTVKLPELNLKNAPVGPITVPEDGSAFSSALSFERVRPLINLFAEPARETLTSAGKRGGFPELARSIGGVVPRQADYDRATTEFEERVRNSIKAVENPLFPSGVPLAPEFTSMFSRAKESAFSAVRPYLAKGVEPELALFMLVTLPVVTVALRAADEQSRRPMEDSRTPASFPPKAGQNRAKARLFPWVKKGQTVSEATPVGVANLEEVMAEVSVGGGVVAAVPEENREEKLRAEMKRLQEELVSATKLAAKVGALERANVRLMKEVADLRKPLSPEEIHRLAEKENERARLRKERDERESKALRGVLERTERLTAAREAMVESFPVRGPEIFADEREAQEAEESLEEPSVAPPLPAIRAKAAEDRSVAAVGGGGASPATILSAEALSAPADSMKGKPKSVRSGVKTLGTAPDRVGTSSSASAGKSDFAAPSVHNGLARPEQSGEEFELEEAGEETRIVAGTAGADNPASVAPTMGKDALPGALPDAVDEVPEDLSRALRGARGFDLDALDLEMDDLRPEDLEELHELEREMGDLDMASLEAEFDKEEDETIANALRMAAESALAHTSGDGRRIRTASPIGATSSRGASSGGLEGSAGFDGGPGSPASETAGPARGVDTALYDAIVEEAAGELSLPPASEGEAAALRRLAQEEARSTDGKWDGRNEWRLLSTAEMKRKTVAQLKEFLDEEGVRYPSRAKKADLVDLVCENVAG